MGRWPRFRARATSDTSAVTRPVTDGEPLFAADDWADAVDRLEAAQAWYRTAILAGCIDPTVAAARQDLLRARERVDGLHRRWADAARRRAAA